MATAWPLLLLVAFGPCTKLSALPTLLLLPILWFGSSSRKTGQLYLKTALAFVVLWLPWLLRNIIMSGYLLYPIAHTNLIAFDWTIPQDVLLLDDFFTRYGSRGLPNQAVVATMSMGQLTIAWVKHSLLYSIYPFTLAIAAFLLPLVAAVFIKYNKPFLRQVALLGVVYYIAALIWLFYSPEYRFGITLFELLILFSLLQGAAFITTPLSWLRVVQICMLLFMVIHFSLDFIQRPSNSHFRFSKYWLYPARDYRYEVDDKYRKTFPYVMLQHNTPLYISDSTHRCLNACLPCMSWRYGEIEMRGNTLQQGFRNVKNEVRKNFPWLPK